MERKIINANFFTYYFTDLQVFGYQPAINVDIFELAVGTTLSIKRKASGRCVYLSNNIEITHTAFRFQRQLYIFQRFQLWAKYKSRCTNTDKILQILYAHSEISDIHTNIGISVF